MQLRGVLLVCAAIAAAGIGCGDDEPDSRGDPAAPAREYVQRSYAGNMAAACAQLTPDARDDLARLATKAGDHAAVPEGCEDVLLFLQSFGALSAVHAGVMDYDLAQKQEPGELSFETVEVDGNGATVRARESDKTVAVTYRDGRWLVAQLDFDDVP